MKNTLTKDTEQDRQGDAEPNAPKVTGKLNILPNHVQKFKEWAGSLVKETAPDMLTKKTVAYISHEKNAMNAEVYPVFLNHPPDFLLQELTRGEKKLPPTVSKAVADRECEGGRWITVHPNGREDEGQPIFICPNPDGSHSIVGGAGGRLNGLRLDHVKSPEEYKTLAKTRRLDREQARKVQEEAVKQKLGEADYVRHKAEQSARHIELHQQNETAEKNFIATVAKAQGVDMAQFDPDPKMLSELDEKIADRVVKRAHEAALSWAHQTTSRVRDVVLTAYDAHVKDALGDVDVKALASDPLTDSGKGYQARISDLAQEHGLSPGDVAHQQENTSLQRFLEQNGHDLPAAKEKRDNVLRMVEKRKESNADVKAAHERLAEQGQGAHAIAALDTTPKAATMGDAVEVLKAAQALRTVQKQVADANRDVSGSPDLRTLPKAAVITSDDVDMGKIAHDLTEESQRLAMMGIVKTSNDLEVAHGTLTEHLSVGQAATLGSIAQTVDGSAIDPLVLDIVGPSCAAYALAARWRDTLTPSDFEAVKDALASQHIATQEAIANQGVEAAEALLKQHGEMEDIDPIDAETMQAVLVQNGQKAELLRRARESAGVARGRLEAAAALNDAMGKSSTKSVMVSMGPMATGDALKQAYAIGLTEPSQYNAQQNMTKEGQFTIHSDGENRILEVHKSGLLALSGTADMAAMERAKISTAIKNGEMDDPHWLPAGITGRPATTFELDPLAFASIDHHLSVSNGDSATDMQDKLEAHIGSRINAGQDAIDVQADLHSASFLSGLGLSPAAETRFRNVLNEVAPLKLATLADRGSESAKQAFRQKFEAHRTELRKRMESYANRAAEGLDKQRIPLDGVAQDCAYQAALADPRTSHAFTKPGDLDRRGRDAIRSYAFEHLFNPELNKQLGREVGPQDIITPLNDAQRFVYGKWQEFKKENGEPYAAIQKDMQENAPEDMFGEKSVSPLASVDLGNPEDVLQVGREQAKTLGYTPVLGADGKASYPMLEPGQKWIAYGEGAEQQKYDPRTQETIVGELKAKIRAKLREHFIGNIARMPGVANRGFNPANVKTASDRWGDYCKDMGGEGRALRTVQEFMQGDLVSRFASVYGQTTGTRLELAQKDVGEAQNHQEAMLGTEARAAITAKKQARYTQAAKRDSKGRLMPGERRADAELEEASAKEGANLVGASETQSQVNTKRATLGKAAEGALAAMLPYINADKPLEAASNVNMSGDAINRQRACKLIMANKRQGLNLSAGSGKTSVILGTFSQLKSEGKANKALLLVPSNTVEQINGECYKFLDPSSGIRWHSDPSASKAERQAAYADPDTHMSVVTPEAFRGDVTAAVAEDWKVTPNEARDRLAAMPQAEQDKAIHGACRSRGWNFDYSVHDEGHRMLGRQWKPDSHMALIGDSVGRMTPYFTYSSADILKNDASEAFSVLSKMNTDKYNDSTKESFLRRYNRNTLASGLALQRELAPYVYTAKVDTGVTHDRTLHAGNDMKLEPKQQQAYNAVTQAFRQARIARQTKDTAGLVGAMKVLSPESFPDGMSEHDAADTASRLSKALGTLRETAHNRVVNCDPNGVKAKWVMKHLSENKGKPTVIFAHNLDAVAMLSEQLKAAGHRVAILRGGMSGAVKSKSNLSFSPSVGEALSDVLVCSDANAMGANLQRGSTLINYDSPQTSMLFEQRIAREVRTGQKNHVQEHSLVADAPYDVKARQRLERKGKLRELMTTPAELIDDSGLAQRIATSRARAFEKTYVGHNEDSERERAA